MITIKTILLVGKFWFVIGQSYLQIQNHLLTLLGLVQKDLENYFPNFIFYVPTVKQIQLVLPYFFSSGWWKSLKIFVLRFPKIMTQRARNLIRIIKEISSTDIMDWNHSHLQGKLHTWLEYNTHLSLNTHAHTKTHTHTYFW